MNDSYVQKKTFFALRTIAHRFGKSRIFEKEHTHYVYVNLRTDLWLNSISHWVQNVNTPTNSSKKCRKVNAMKNNTCLNQLINRNKQNWWLTFAFKRCVFTQRKTNLIRFSEFIVLSPFHTYISTNISVDVAFAVFWVHQNHAIWVYLYPLFFMQILQYGSFLVCDWITECWAAYTDVYNVGSDKEGDRNSTFVVHCTPEISFFQSVQITFYTQDVTFAQYSKLITTIPLNTNPSTRFLTSIRQKNSRCRRRVYKWTHTVGRKD